VEFRLQQQNQRVEEMEAVISLKNQEIRYKMSRASLKNQEIRYQESRGSIKKTRSGTRRAVSASGIIEISHR
jgi:hypothetical protein